MKLKDIGRQIRNYRQIREMTQQQLAEKLGVRWEMVSRYERGITSPMSRIGEISEALDVGISELLQNSNNPNSLYDGDHSARIPLYTSIPEKFNFVDTQTQYVYSAPEWILKIDKEAFVIESSIVKINATRLYPTGPIYISPNTKPDTDDLCLFVDNAILKIDKFENISAKVRIIGVVLAQENRLK